MVIGCGRPGPHAAGLGLSKRRWPPATKRRMVRLSYRGGGPHPDAARAVVVPFSAEVCVPHQRGLCSLKAAKAPTYWARRRSQRGIGPRTKAAGSSMVPKRRKVPLQSGGGLGGSKPWKADAPCGGAWTVQSDEGPRTKGTGA